jgi:hypothetical protein
MLPTSMLGDYSTSASSMPSCFPHRTDLLGNLFLITSLLDLRFLLFFFLDHHTDHPARHDARIILMSASTIPSEIFSSSFRSTGSLLPIGCHSTSLWFGKTSNRSAAKLICSLLFGPTCMLFDLSIALQLRHDLSKVAAHTPRSGLVRHG